MPSLGAHMSVAGGVHLAFDRLEQVGGKALQIFTRNQRQWRETGLSSEVAMLFRMKWEESGRIPVAAHDIYLINLAAGNPEISQKSIEAFARELQRCELLGVPYLVMHPGAHLGDGFEPGLERLVRNLDQAIDSAGTESVSVLIENTAGQGSSLGSSFEQIAYILGTSKYGLTMGVCFDTCHGLAAGYDIRRPDAYRETMKRFDEIIGLERLKFFHLNDSRKGLGSRVDRHEHIGKGLIGLEGFRLLLNDPRFQNHPMVLETPKGLDLDRQNLGLLRSLISPSYSPGPSTPCSS